MNFKAWLVAVAFLVWAGGSWYHYMCSIKGYCADSTSSAPLSEKDPAESAEPEQTADLGPLSFELNSQGVFPAESWPALRDSLLADTASGKQLSISCPYSLDEKNASSFANVGAARAHAVRSLLAEYMDTTGVQVKGHLLESQETTSEGVFSGARFTWLTNSATVKEMTDGALIYFPYKSDKQLDDPGINAYLDELVSTLSQNEQSVEVIGHTDDKGSAGYNEKLGQERANAIKALLVGRGLDASRIQALSMGEMDPLYPNTTEENKAKNRRTEIKIK